MAKKAKKPVKKAIKKAARKVAPKAAKKAVKKAVKKVVVKAVKKAPAPKPAKKLARHKVAKKPEKPFLPRRPIVVNPKAPLQKFILKSAVPMNLREVEEKPLSASEVHKFQDILTQKRDDLMTVVQRKKEQEFQAVDEEIGDEADIATRSVEREMLFELTDSEKQTLDMVEAALRKMEKGVYGLCESCQKPIGRLRIDVMPWARYCIRCQSLQEVPAGE